MGKVFIIHGAYGNPEENWFPWLKKELEKLGEKVFVPKFPTPENQTLENWNKVFSEYEKEVDEETIFVGHSLAPAFIMHLIEKLDHPIKAAFFVSGFSGLLNHEIDKINHTFVEGGFDWNKIRTNCKNFFLYHSDNDPYVPLKYAKELEEKLNGKLAIILNAGHFNSEFGYTKFPKLLEDMLLILNEE